MLVTATGLELQAWGGIAVTVDGAAVEPGETVAYRGCLVSGVPNLAFCIGYVNASWTLRADLVARYVTRLLAYMDAQGYAAATPRLPRGMADPAPPRPVLGLHPTVARRLAAPGHPLAVGAAAELPARPLRDGPRRRRQGHGVRGAGARRGDRGQRDNAALTSRRCLRLTGSSTASRPRPSRTTCPTPPGSTAVTWSAATR